MDSVSLVVVGSVFMTVACAAPLLFGDRLQRLAAGTYLASGWLSMVVQGQPGSDDVRRAILAIDLAELAVLVGVALVSRSAWARMAAAFMLLGAMTHLAYAMDPRIHAWAYVATMNLCGYGVETTLLVAGLCALVRPDGGRRAQTVSGAPNYATRSRKPLRS
jgi:hypothetical protein